MAWTDPAGRSLGRPDPLLLLMQPSIHLLAAAAVCFGAIGVAPVAAQSTGAQIEGSAQAVVVEPAGITAIEDLRFGAIMQPATAGTVTIGTDSSVTATGGAIVGITTPQPPSSRGAGRFTIVGDANRFFRIEEPKNFTISNGVASMTVKKLRSNLNGRDQFDADGRFELRIGGELSIGANQPTGDYTGTYEVSVVYQ